MNKQTNRNKIAAGRMNNDAKDCKASLELAHVYIGIANSSSTGSSIIPAIECMMVFGIHFIDHLFRERKVHKNAHKIYICTSGLIRRWSDW